MALAVENAQIGVLTTANIVTVESTEVVYDEAALLSVRRPPRDDRKPQY